MTRQRRTGAFADVGLKCWRIVAERLQRFLGNFAECLNCIVHKEHVGKLGKIVRYQNRITIASDAYNEPVADRMLAG